MSRFGKGMRASLIVATVTSAIAGCADTTPHATPSSVADGANTESMSGDTADVSMINTAAEASYE